MTKGNYRMDHTCSYDAYYIHIIMGVTSGIQCQKDVVDEHFNIQYKEMGFQITVNLD